MLEKRHQSNNKHKYDDRKHQETPRIAQFVLSRGLDMPAANLSDSHRFKISVNGIRKFYDPAGLNGFYNSLLEDGESLLVTADAAIIIAISISDS